MINKNQVFLGLAAALSMSAIAVVPAQAEPIENNTLLSQLRGYDFYSPIEVFQDDWLQWKFTEDIAIGRVKAKVGDICFVSFISPDGVEFDNRTVMREKLACGWDIKGGDDVIVGYNGDGWTILSEDNLPVVYHYALPAWITRLELKEEAEVQRTAIDWGDTRQVELPALRPQATTPAPVFEPSPEPIRGMW